MIKSSSPFNLNFEYLATMSNTTAHSVKLIADIGGTNIRLAIAEQTAEKSYVALETFQCARFSSLSEAISHYITTSLSNYLKKNKAISNRDNLVIDACLAIACPVDDDLITMTNLPWQFSQKALKQQLGLNSLTLINDYTAIAMAIPLLTSDNKVQVGTGKAIPNQPITVCGPGTGLGVANLISVNNQWHCLSGEGGHVDFAPVNAIEIDILTYLHTIKSRVSYEQLLSGYGLEQIYQALSAIEGDKNTVTLSAQGISQKALNGDCTRCQKSLDVFCNILGSFSGNLALTLNSQGGVYIAGGIVPRFIDFLKSSQFRKRFENKGRLTNMIRDIATYVITEPQPGLVGAAAFLFQQQAANSSITTT